MLLVSMQQIMRIRHLSLELVEVVTRAVNWPAEKESSKKNKKTKQRMNASCLLLHNLNLNTQSDVFFLIFTLTCRDRRRNRFPVEFIVHKHLTIPL